MKKIKIITPENIEIEYPLADLGSRMAAAIIDSLIQMLLIIPLCIAIFLVWYFAPESWNKYYGWFMGIFIIVLTCITYGYFIVLELSMNGQTIGKKKLNLRTIRKNGQPLTLKHSAIRNLFRIFVDMYGIGVILIFFSKEHNRVGDLMASTIVVVEGNRVQPVTLESLERKNENFSYYLTEEENELLRNYFARKNNMEDSSQISQELKLHFKKKFEELNILNECQELINRI